MLLRSSRKLRRLTQEALAQAAACALDTIKKLEGDRRRPSRHLARQLADVLRLEGDAREVFLVAARCPTHAPPTSNQATHANGLVPALSPITVRHRLPRAALPFIGRQRELSHLLAALCDPAIQLLTLVAPGGMGKTRLALAAAEQLVQQQAFRDGVAWVDFTAIDTTEGLELTLAHAIGLPLDSHGPAPRRQLLDYLQAKRLLLLLDNCEHLRDALAELAASILREAPEVVLIVTSRERLGLQAERILPLEGMDANDDGANLFAASARCAQPDFTLDAESRPLVQAICSRLSGMPLAIELAARWINTLSLTTIGHELAQSDALLVSRVSDRAERHRSVRAVCEASLARLLPADQTVFARSAVFRGGARWEALQTVTGTTLWQLQALVEHALLRFDPRLERYTFHELLRQYAEERLGSNVAYEQAVRERHAAYFLGALANKERALKGVGQWEALAAISAERENLRAAWRWAVENRAIQLMVAATEALTLAYAWLGYHEAGLDAMRLATEAMHSSTSPPAPVDQATLLVAHARFALLCGQRMQALDLLEQAEQLLVAGRDDSIATDMVHTRVLLERGRSLAHQDFCAAHADFTRSKTLSAKLGDHWGEATTLAELGYLLTSMSPNFGEAKLLLEQSAAHFRTLGDQIGLSEALMHLCRTNRNLGNFPQALVTAREVYAIAEGHGNARLLAQAGSTLGTMLAIGNHYHEAYERLNAALQLTHELGRRGELPNLYCAKGYVAAFLGRYGEARSAYHHGLQLAQQLGDELERCSLLSGLAGTALAEGAYAEAFGLADAAVALSDRLGEGYLRSRSLPYRALALRRLGIGDCGRRDALATLRLGLTARSEILVALWVVALLLADGGQTRRAAEVFALGEMKRQLDNQWLQDIGLHELRSIIAGLPLQVVAQAQARWAQHDIWSALEELCAELEAGWA
jgi:predicted ATPase/tetratricopeptide (TPR) repeat protein/DNA-binding XRE family transcriptional regulator